MKVTKKIEIIKLIESLHPFDVQNDLIRLGPKGDGGYLIPNDLDGIEACFSPGVDKVSQFEIECLKHGMKIFLADKSVEKPNINLSEDKYDFIKMFVGCTSNDDFITMDDWVNSKCKSDNSDLLLQMDIEGSEYDVIINMSSHLMNRFRIMVIEFHSLERLWHPYFFKLYQTVFKKILQTHICVHIHPNNCAGIDFRGGIEIPLLAEFTFLRKDRNKTRNYANKFPHDLDFDNTNNEAISLPKIWYKST